MNRTLTISISLPDCSCTATEPAPPIVLVANGAGQVDNQRTLTWRGVPGCVLVLDAPLSTNTDPSLATMDVFAANDTTPLASLDYNGADTGVPCRIVYNGKTYSTSLTNGEFILSSAA